MEKVDVQETILASVESDVTEQIDDMFNDKMATAAEDLDKKLTDEQKQELMQKYFVEMIRKTNRRRLATKKKVTQAQRKKKRTAARNARRKNRK